MAGHVVRLGEQAVHTSVGPGLTIWSIVDETQSAAVHTGFEVCELAPGSAVPARVQSFEECFYVLAGAPVLQTAAGATVFAPGDYGLIPVGEAHSWRSGSGHRPARWARMLAPQPRSRYGGDTLAVAEPGRHVPSPVDVRDPRNRRYGHVEPVNMDMRQQSQELLAVSASMRTALLVYSGITVKMMVDSDLGAQLTTMFMVQYAPDGVAGPHDHPFEETYLFLEGQAEATFDGERYLLGPGDAAFAGVGCVHGFRNAGQGPLRWLETQAPQPPARHSYRFVRDWDYLRSALDGVGGTAPVATEGDA
jgi:quercetin dioxygenase-like cupin family protein